ncbi:MAG: hypothetical protein JWP32_1749 [Schumannella sp.]|nr:hypothetical protein [Schumannella sp.]
MGFPLYSEGPRQKVKPLVEASLRLRKATTTYRITKEGMQMNDFDSVGEYAVPVDPMDDLQCESCQ